MNNIPSEPPEDNHIYLDTTLHVKTKETVKEVSDNDVQITGAIDVPNKPLHEMNIYEAAKFLTSEDITERLVKERFISGTIIMFYIV
jgi:hypothetical protein